MASEEANPTELTATQYVILAENQRKKKALAETKNQFSKVAEENKALLKQLEYVQKENYEVTEHLRRELVAKTERVADLEAEIGQIKQEKQDALTQLEAQWTAREARQVAEASAQKKELQAQLDQLNSTLNGVMDYKKRQVEVDEAMLRLKEENQELKERLEQQKVELERYYLELNTKARKEYEQRMEELKKSAEEEIDERLDASVKRILQQNRRMAEELKIHVQETDVLQREVRILEDERNRLLREVSLKTELEEGYAKRGAKQNHAIKDAQAKVSTLEQSLQQVMQDFEKERQAIMRQTQSQISEAQAEADALRRLVKLKTRELKNIRRLAQEVLLQRSDVETFLLSSLHQVRKEVERGSMRQAPHQKADLLNLTAGNAGRLDIKELPWEDRERILRLLFAKINNQAQQMYFHNLPSHPLESQLTSQGPQPGSALSGMCTDAGPAGIV